MEKPLFSVLTYNFDGYEIVRELIPETMNPNAEYIYLTNDRSLKSETWTMKYIDYPSDTKTGFGAVCYARYHPFDYVNSDIVFKIDGSIEIRADITPLINFFIKNEYDISVMIHQERNTMINEYLAWAERREVKIPQLEKCLRFLSEQNYDIFNYKGLYIPGVQIQRNTDFSKNLNNLTYDLCKMLGENTNLGIERIDQTIFSFVLNKYYNNKKVLPLNSDMLLPNRELPLHEHKTNRFINYKRTCEPFLFNNPCIVYSIYP